MKSFKKSILAVGLALAVITSIGGTAVYATPRYVSRNVGGYGVTASSDIKYGYGTAYTSYGDYGSVTVQTTYYYCNVRNGQSGYKTGAAGHFKSASVTLTAPNGTKSVSMLSDHSCSAHGESWSGPTFDDREA